MKHQPKSIFYWTSGQDDNLGDVVLRRRMLHDLQELGQVNVHVGRGSRSFIDGLKLTDAEVVYTDFVKFCLSSLRTALKGRMLFAFNPGEVGISRKMAIMHAMLIPTLLLTRLTGGRAVRIGVGMSSARSYWGLPIRATTWLCRENIWRDEESRDWAGRGRVGPDWAFGLDESRGGSASSHRTLMAISYRGDHDALTDEFVEALSKSASAHGLEPVVVVQVRRDSEAMRALADRLGCRCVDWVDGDSHLEQEDKLLQIYRESKLVVSDRLHVLILGATAGCIVAGLMEHPDSKVGRHFQAAGFPRVSWDVSRWDSQSIAKTIDAVMEATLAQVHAVELARARVDMLSDVLRNVPLPKVDYFAGGLRISVGPNSNTPGPRTHILNFVGALRAVGVETDLTLASDLPFLGRFASLRQSDFASASRKRLLIADVVRLAACLWTGINVFASSFGKRDVTIIYERIAVFQTMSSFHCKKRRATRIVEANGVLARETGGDRNGLVLKTVAEMLERHAIRRADLVVCVSEALKNEIVAYANIDPAKVLVIPNAVNRSILELPRAAMHDEYVVGFVGSVVKWQTLDALIRAIYEVRKSGHNVRAEIIGDGPELANLSSLAESCDLRDHVQFLGKLDPPAVSARMTTWNCGFAGHQKSTSEVMYHSPLKLYEYSGAGLDIVCTASGDATALASAGVRVKIIEGANMQREIEEALGGFITMTPLSADELNDLRANLSRTHSWEERASRVVARARSSKGNAADSLATDDLIMTGEHA
jgi:glycosyltransferase involved in cell wall biosynthesis